MPFARDSDRTIDGVSRSLCACTRFARNHFGRIGNLTKHPHVSLIAP